MSLSHILSELERISALTDEQRCLISKNSCHVIKIVLKYMVQRRKREYFICRLIESAGLLEPEQCQIDEVRSGAILVKRCSQNVFRVKELIK